MSEKLTTIIQKVDESSPDDNMYSQKPSSSFEQCFDESPDWSIPVESGYLLTQELGCGNLSVFKAQDIDKKLESFYEAHLNKTVISYKNQDGKKSHSFILFYGTKDQCDKALPQYQQGLKKKSACEQLNQLSQQDTTGNQAKKSEIPEVDLTSTSPPLVNKKLKREEIPIFNYDIEAKIDTIHHAIEELAKKISKIEKDLSEVKTSVFKPVAEITKKAINISDYYFKPDKIKESELTTEFMKILMSRRASGEWRSMVRSHEIEGVTPQQSKNIKELFLYGPRTVGSFMRSLARELFGEERIVTTLLGEDGEFLKGVKNNQDRAKLFSVDEELKLINLLKLIDSDFFTKREAYNFLVRNKINSYGRDLKKILDPEKTSATLGKETKRISKDSYRITSYFKRISRPGASSGDPAEKGDSPKEGPSGLQSEPGNRSNLVAYHSSSQSSIDE